MPKQTAATPRRRQNAPRGSGRRAVRPFPDVAARSDAAPRSGATLPDGLDPLDRQRASSLADEGGAAGAAVEAQPPQGAAVARSAAGKLWLAAWLGLAGLAALYLRRPK